MVPRHSVMGMHAVETEELSKCQPSFGLQEPLRGFPDVWSYWECTLGNGRSTGQLRLPAPEGKGKVSA